MTAPGPETVAALCEALAPIPAAIVADVLQAGGLRNQALSWTIGRLAGGPFTGPAVCLSGESGPPPDAARSDAIVFDADRAMYPGCVAVLAAGGHRVGAVTGGNTVSSWIGRGCRAVVTDGLVRDLEAMDGASVHAAGRTVFNTKGRWSYRTIGEPVRLPGQEEAWLSVSPGDIVHGDADGVVVIPRRFAPRVLADALVTRGEEERMLARIRAGVDRETVYGEARRFGHVRPYRGDG